MAASTLFRITPEHRNLEAWRAVPSSCDSCEYTAAGLSTTWGTGRMLHFMRLASVQLLTCFEGVFPDPRP